MRSTDHEQVRKVRKLFLDFFDLICINYKIACFTHTALHDHQPTYLAQLLHPYNPTRSLRSSDQHLLTIPRTRFHISDRSFDVAAKKSGIPCLLISAA